VDALVDAPAAAPQFAPPQFAPPQTSPLQFAPPQFAPPQFAAQQVAAPQRRRGLLVTAIVAGSLLLVGAIIAGSFALGNLITEAIANTPPVGIDDGSASGPVDDIVNEPLIGGDAASPHAINPTECPDSCFTAAVIGKTIGSDINLSALGVPKLVQPWGEMPSSTPQGEYRYAADYWTSETGTPDECFVVTYPSPVAVGIAERPGQSMDGVYFTGTNSSDDEYSSLSSAARLFTDTASATAHMEALDSMVAACTHYEMGTGSSYWTADVTSAPQVTIPSNVAASGWVEVSPFGRYYVYDLQRANVVVRSTLFTDGAVTEAEFHDYIESLAVQLGELDPAAG
jgi:hypothetical protein